MRDWDLQFLVHFIKRPGMYTGKNNHEGIDNFLMAYELGSKRECNFRNQLSEQIENDYGTAMPSEGLIEQFKIVANEINRNWFELFKEESLKLLCTESDGKGEARYASIIRKEFHQFLKKIPSKMDPSFAIGWNQVYRQVKEWPGVNLTKEELKLIDEIKDEISFFYETFRSRNYDNELKETMMKKLEFLKVLMEEKMS